MPKRMGSSSQERCSQVKRLTIIKKHGIFGFMKKTVILSMLSVILITVLTNCSSLPEPSPKGGTLITGWLAVEINTTGRMKVMDNSNRKYNIKLYFKNNATGKETIISTKSDGWLVSNKINSGSYTLNKIFLEVKELNTIYSFTLGGSYNTEIKEGVVNNIGFTTINIEDGKYSYGTKDYSVIQTTFKEKYPNSEWNNHEWIETAVFNSGK